MSRFDPRGMANRALLVGVSEYDHRGPPHGVPGHLPAVEHNLRLLREVLAGGGIFDEDEIEVLRSPDLGGFHHALREAADSAKGLLLVYFAGHAAVPNAPEPLFLQLRGAEIYRGHASVFPGAERFDTVLAMLAASEAERIVVVLDCCYAGNASFMWEQLEPFESRQRVLLLMSVLANHRIDAGDGGTPTPFTQELVRVLGGEGGVGFAELAAELHARMSASGLQTLRNKPWLPLSRAEADRDVLLSARGDPETKDPDPAPEEPEAPEDPEDPAQSGSGQGSPDAPGGRPTLVIAPPPGVPGTSTDTPEPTPEESPSPPGGHLPPASRPDPAEAPPPSSPHAARQPSRPPARLHSRQPSLLRIPVAWVRRQRRAVRAVLTLVLLLALGTAGSLPLLLGGGGASCSPPLELRVLTDPDLEATITAAADAYLTSDRNTDGHGCRRTGITVYSAGSADVVTALRRETEDWQEPRVEDTNPQRDVGPQPDVWIPGSPADVERVKSGQEMGGVAHLATIGAPLAYSPVVLAVPRSLAGDPSNRGAGRPLRALLDDLTGRAADSLVRRPDPEYTDAALLATMGLYGENGDAGGAGGAGGAERLVAQAGPPSRTAADLMCTLPEDPSADARTAALVPEFLLTTGVGCDRTTRHRRIAEYPSDVPGVQPTFVRVRWEHADRDGAARDDAAEGFREWLAGDGGRAVFARDGFRAVGGHQDLLDPEHVADGVLRDPTGLARDTARSAMDDVLTRYRGAGGPGRVLYLLDDSGSMGGLWDGPSGGPGLLAQSLGGLGEVDEFGVWTVSGLGSRNHATLLPFGHHPRNDAERTVVRAKVRDAEADPAAALLAALDEMHGRGTDDNRPELIVYITDDEDDNRLTGAALDEVLNKARAAKGRIPVTMVSLVSGGCDHGSPDARVSAASGGRCLDADDDLGAGLTAEVARTGTGED